MQIIATKDGRALEHNGERAPLPALAVGAVVHVYETPNGLWIGAQEPGKPRPIYPGAGGKYTGKVELPADEAEAAEKLASEKRATLTATIQQHLDETAQTRGYDGILSLCTYATSSNARFAKEGQAGVEWRDAVWATGYQLLDAVVAGEREAPTESELLAMLPEIQW